MFIAVMIIISYISSSPPITYLNITKIYKFKSGYVHLSP